MPKAGVNKIKSREYMLDKAASRIVIIAVAIAVLPILSLFNNSFSVIIDGILLERINARLVGIKNYYALLMDSNLLHYLKNSLILCAMSIIPGIALALPAAYALSRYRFRGINMFGFFIALPLMLPTIAYFLPFAAFIKSMELFTGIKFYNTYTGYVVLAIMYAVMYLPFSIWVLRGFIVSVPVEVEEAAKVDGCSISGIFFRILLPLLSSGIVVTAMLLLMLIWNEMALVNILMTDEKMRTVALFPGFDQARYIAGPLSSIPVFVIFFILQKNFMKGITGGALKG